MINLEKTTPYGALWLVPFMHQPTTYISLQQAARQVATLGCWVGDDVEPTVLVQLSTSRRH